MVVIGNLKISPGMRQNGRCVFILCVFFFFLLISTQHVYAGNSTSSMDLGSLSCKTTDPLEISLEKTPGVNQVYYTFTFTINAPGVIRIYTDLPDGSKMNPKGTLYFEGTKLISDNNSGNGKSFRIETYLSSSGSYELVVSGPHNDDYNLLISFPNSGKGCGGCMDIADAPLTTQIQAAPPLVMFLLDDSGSMDFDILCDTDSGKFLYGDGKSSAYVRGDHNIDRVSSWSHDVSEFWKTQWSGCNKVYYNPDVTYSPWPGYSNADSQATRKHSVFNYYIKDYDDGTKIFSIDMDSAKFDEISGVAIRYAHYYTKSGEDVYLVNLDGGAAKYYKVGEQGAYHKIEKLTVVSSTDVPDDIVIDSYDDTLQNMANWYQYSRNRELAAKGAVAKVISGVSGVKIGLHSINNGKVCKVKPINVDGVDLTDTVLEKLYSVDSYGGTELRSALYEVGQYYDDTDEGETGGIGASPYATDANGGTCQQAFTIVMTDGYYNGDEHFESVGNADADSSAETDESEWDGVPFADANSDTLADVAMHFYERDLRPDLNNYVPVSEDDENNQQHMVTYTLAFGVTGTLTPNQYDCPAIPPGSGDPSSNCPGDTGKLAWPDPASTDKAKIDDLFHTAVNGRGKFLSAGNSEALLTALADLMKAIQDRVMTGASVTMNSNELGTDSTLYQGYFDSSNWTGDLKAFSLSKDATGKVTTAKAWSAQDVFKAKKGSSWWNSTRKIFTFNGSSGVPFRRGNLSDGQKDLLSKEVLNYVRGDSRKEKAHGGNFRNRGGLLLGDIVNSSPVHENGVVYVGANDGMLHAFDASNGDELFAYIPSFVFENLSTLAGPEYSHNYYVDNTVYTRTVKSGSTKTTWLVGGLGKGGKGYYGIDITDPSDISKNNIPTIWEYPAANDSDDDMGYSYSEPAIVKANTGESVILFGNGYDSPDSTAVLYILGLDGSLITKIDTHVGNPNASEGQCNGLSTPVPVDLDYNGTMDVVYAGDLLGNLWKFDLSGSTAGSWNVAYGGNPLFTAQSKTGGTQPIVSKPAVMNHCDGTRKGNILIFGTGRYLVDEDTLNNDGQSIYCIWDWADEWDAPNSKYYGSFEAVTDGSVERSLSNVSGVTLLRQRVTSGSNTFINSSTNTLSWFSPSEWEDAASNSTSYDGGTHVGWYIDLPELGERMITRTQLIDGIAVGVSIIPKNTPCTSGGDSVIYMLDACTGGEPNEELFDKDGNGEVDADDGIYSGKRYRDDIYFAPAIVNNAGGDTDKLFFDEDEQMDVRKEVLGLYYWRFVE